MIIKKMHTFTMQHTADDGQEYSGTFTCRRLSMIDRSKVNVRKSQLSGGMYCVRDDNGNPTGLGIDQETEWLNYMMAVLEVVLTQKPTWFKLDEISDQDLVFKVFSEVISFENSFRKRGDGGESEGGNFNGSGQAGSEVKHSQANAAGVAPKVVDQKVSSALDA